MAEATAPSSRLAELSELVGTAKTRRHNLVSMIAREGTVDVVQHLPDCRCEVCGGRPSRRARGTSPRSGFLLSDVQTSVVDLDAAVEKAARILRDELDAQNVSRILHS